MKNMLLAAAVLALSGASAPALLVAFTAGAEAATNLNSSKSNVYKISSDCEKAGGAWRNGRDGVGCYLPLPAKKPTKPTN